MTDTVGGWGQRLVMRWRLFKARMQQRFCHHEFLLADLKLTGMQALEEPGAGGYESWAKYYEEVYTHDSHIKRIRWPCRK